MNAHDSSLLGPLESLFNDPDVVEIMVDGHDRVYVEKQGANQFEDVVPSPFQNEQQLLDVMQAIAAASGRALDERQPMIDVRVLGTARCNMVIPPIALTGPTLVLRKFVGRKPLSAEELLNFGTWNEDILTFLRAAVQARLNIAISGGTGSGKTTILNIIAGMIPADERIVVVENATELRLSHRRVVKLESRPPDAEGKGEVTIDDLVINALRMRPDRLIVGEVRAGEAINVFQAMNTGHDGTLFSLHAISPLDALARLEVMVQLSGVEVPLLAIREQMANGLDLIVHQERLGDGTRKIVKISEVLGLKGSVIEVQDLFEFRQTGRDEAGRIKGYHTATGQIPRFLTRLRDAGADLSVSLFTPS